MTNFVLTPNADDFDGGAGSDLFKGLGGGTDTRHGKGGNNSFYIQYGQLGVGSQCELTRSSRP